MIRSVFYFLLIFPTSFVYSQIEGVGYSSIYTIKEKVNSINEALFNAQENAAINSGSNVGRLSIGKSTNELRESNSKKTIATFQSKRTDLRTHMIKAVVKTIGEPIYDTIWISKKKYKIKVSGKFVVDQERIENLLPQLDDLGEKIKIEVQENACNGRFYDYAKEYFRQKQNSIFLSRQKFPLGETDFGIVVFSDRISLTDKKSAPNYSIKIFKVNSCNEIITQDYNVNAILDEIRKEIFYYYLIR